MATCVRVVVMCMRRMKKRRRRRQRFCIGEGKLEITAKVPQSYYQGGVEEISKKRMAECGGSSRVPNSTIEEEKVGEAGL